MTLPEYKVESRLLELSKHPLRMSKRLTIRGALIPKGTELILRLSAARNNLTQLQKDAGDYIERIEISEGLDETVDGVLGLNSEAEIQLSEATKMLSDTSLARLVEEGVPSQILQALQEAGSIVRGLEHTIADARKAMDTTLKPSL